METAWEVIKGIGSIAGLGTAGFVIYDRMTRFRPRGIIEAEPLLPNTVMKKLVLELTNRADRTAIFEWDNERENRKFGITADNSFKGMASVVAEEKQTITLCAGESIRLLLLPPPDLKEIDGQNSIEARIKWRFVQASIWQRPRNLTVSVKRDDLAIMNPDFYGYGALDEIVDPVRPAPV